MLYFRILIIYRTDNGNDIKTIMGDVPIFQVMLYGVTQIVTLMIVDGIRRFTIITTTACLHFHENGGFTILCNDIDVTVLGMPVTFENDITLLTQESGSQILAPDASLQMLRPFIHEILTHIAFSNQILAFLKSIFYPAVFVGDSWHQTIKGNEKPLCFVKTPFVNP